MLCARREEWLTPAIASLRARGFTADGAICDVARPEQVQAVVDATLAAHGRIDILVNNAGVSWGARPEDMPIDKWQQGHRHEPHRRVSLLAGGRPGDVEAGIRPDHQHRVGRRASGGRARAALRRLRR